MNFDIENFENVNQIWNLIKHIMNNITNLFDNTTTKTNEKKSTDNSDNGLKITVLNIITPLLDVFFNIFGSETMDSKEEIITLKFSVSESEDDKPTSFFEFCSANKKLINIIIRQKPTILNEGFHFLVKKYFNLLEFDNKRT